MEGSTSVPATATGNGRFATPPPGTRTAEEIRRDIVTQRTELSGSVEVLRTKWGEVTDVGLQLKKHRSQILVGAAVAGFVIGGVLALRRR